MGDHVFSHRKLSGITPIPPPVDITVTACETCGAFVENTGLHARWHDQMESLLVERISHVDEPTTGVPR